MSIHKDYSRPLARRSDPITSHIAANNLRTSGKLGDQAQHVLQLVKNYPGHTAIELSKYSHLDRYQIQRRLSDLADPERRQYIKKGTARKCSESGNMSVTWYPVD